MGAMAANDGDEESETAQRRTEVFLQGNPLHLVCSRRAYDEYLLLLTAHEHHRHQERFAPGVVADVISGEVDRDGIPARFALIRIRTLTGVAYHVAFVRADMASDISSLRLRQFIEGLRMGYRPGRFTKITRHGL